MGGSLIKSVERVNKEKTLVALTSLKTFIESVDTNKPNLKDPIVKLMYESSILKNKPKQGKKNKRNASC